MYSTHPPPHLKTMPCPDPSPDLNYIRISGGADETLVYFKSSVGDSQPPKTKNYFREAWDKPLFCINARTSIVRERAWGGRGRILMEEALWHAVILPFLPHNQATRVGVSGWKDSFLWQGWADDGPCNGHFGVQVIHKQKHPGQVMLYLWGGTTSASFECIWVSD